MNRFLSYFIFLLTIVAALLTLLQSAYLVLLRLSLFSYSFDVKHATVIFIQDMIVLLLIIAVVEIALLWLLVVVNFISQRQGLIATLSLIIIVGFVSLFAFSALIFNS